MSSVASDSDYQTISESGRQRPAWAVPLSKEALFRIQLSLSSRRSSVMVLETVCRVFLGAAQSGGAVRGAGLDPADTKWAYQTTGVPGLLVEYRDVRDMSLFSLKLVVVELESGLCTWEGRFGTAANYQVFAEDFHTFWMPELGQVGIEFGDLSEAERMRVLLREWLERLQTSFKLIAQQEAENLSRKKKKKSQVERQDSQTRLEKKQISTPCNFIHVSGITMGRTEECEKELQGTVRRFFRGTIAGLSRTSTLSLSSKTRAKPARLSAASSEGNLTAPLSKLSLPAGPMDARPTDTKRSESSQSGKEKKYFSLQRRKKGSQDSDPSDISTTPDPLPISQSETAFASSPSATDLDNITPNTRRKQIVQSRVITGSDDVTRDQVHGDLSQRRSSLSQGTSLPQGSSLSQGTSLSQGPERGRLDQRKFSAPNLHYYRRDPAPPIGRPGLLRQHSELPSMQSDLMYDSPDTLYPPPYPYPPHSATSSHNAHSAPYVNSSAPYHNQIPYQTNSVPYQNNTVTYPPRSGPSPLPTNSFPYPPRSGPSPLPTNSFPYPPRSGPSPLPAVAISYSSSTVPYTTHSSPYHSQSDASQQSSPYLPETNRTVSVSNHSIPCPKQSDQFQNGYFHDPNQLPPHNQSQQSLPPSYPSYPSYPTGPAYPTGLTHPTDLTHPGEQGLRGPGEQGLRGPGDQGLRGPRGRHGRARMSEKRDLRRLSNSYTSFGHATSQVDV